MEDQKYKKILKKMEDKKWREITITLVSADNLPDVRDFGRMKVYAEVFINGLMDETTSLSPTDTDGGVNPIWNFSFKYKVTESTLVQMLCKPDREFVVYLYCRRSFGSHRFVGRAIIPLESLIDEDGDPKHESTYPLLGTPNGTLKMSLANLSGRVSAPEETTAGSRTMSLWDAAADEVLRTALRTGVLLFLGADIN